MIQIAGGCYLEWCSEPYWSQLYGSGLRAAAALSGLLNGGTLSTYISEDQVTTLEAVARTYKITCTAKKLPSTFRFSYEHPLAAPIITPHPSSVPKCDPIIVEAENVLRFGLLAGDVVVHAHSAVYDPQSADNPRPFSENGSQAEHLAIIVNLREAYLLSQETELSAMGKKLLELDGVEAVVIKQGPSGCIVMTESRVRKVPAYATDRVWLIGSGDVFAASFAYHWIEERLNPETAAIEASRAAAYYSSNCTLPIPTSHATIESSIREPVTVDNETLGRARVYLAGPFFTMAQRWMIQQTRSALLDLGLKVFSPYHDVGPGPAERVVPADIEGLETSSVVLALLDGLDPGTVFEVGYARKKMIPVVVLAQGVKEEDLKMLKGANCQVVDDLSTAVYKTVWALATK